MTALIFLFLTLASFAQEFQYRLEGPFTSSEATVNFAIRWNETSTTIHGVYEDNFFAASGNKVLLGSVLPGQRAIDVQLSQETQKVRSLSFKTEAILPNFGSRSISLSITTRDTLGRTVDSSNTFAWITRLNSTSQDEDNCVIGFGALTGYCGIYTGTFVEISDKNNRCNLLSGRDPRLELGTDTYFRLHLSPEEEQSAQTTHNISAFIPSPQTNSINISTRNCSALPGTTFIPVISLAC